VDSELVVGRIYDAVSEPGRWVAALDAARELLDVDAMMLLYCDLTIGRPEVIESTGFDRQALDLFAAGDLGADELIRESMDRPAGVVVSSTRTFQDARVRTTLISRTLLEPSQLTRIAGAAALNSQAVYASLWMARSASRPDFSVHDLHVFGELLPHVARAMTVHHRVSRAELQASMAAGAFDRMAVGVILLDVAGSPVMVNREADRIIADQDGLGLVGNTLIAARSTQTRELRRLIDRVGRAASLDDTDGFVGGGAVRLRRHSGRPPYHLVVLPLPRRCQPGDRGSAVVVLFITDPEKAQSPIDHLCGDLYGLTRAEIRLVSQLLEGGGLTVAAKQLGLSRNTVHSQLASVFQKTGTRSQNELLRLILGGIAPVKAPDEASGFNLPVVDLGS
jgi:DNA-binding CsgD family transcriptional regulator